MAIRQLDSWRDYQAPRGTRLELVYLNPRACSALTRFTQYIENRPGLRVSESPKPLGTGVTSIKVITLEDVKLGVSVPAFVVACGEGTVGAEDFYELVNVFLHEGDPAGAVEVLSGRITEPLIPLAHGVQDAGTAVRETLAEVRQNAPGAFGAVVVGVAVYAALKIASTLER